MSIFERVERFLWRRGFVYAPLRAATRNLLIFSAIFLLLGAALVPWSDQIFWAAVSAVLSSWNFYTLALFIQHAMPAVIPEGDRNGLATARVVKKRLLLKLVASTMFIITSGFSFFM